MIPPGDVSTIRRLVLEHTPCLKARVGPALTNNFGVVLGEDVLADGDMPALPTSRMDGYALRATDVVLHRVMEIAGTTRAGDHRGQPLPAGMCHKITTGAALPENADCVIPVEDTRTVDGGIEIIAAHCTDHRFIRFPGEEFRQGQVLVPAGTVLGPVEYGLLALAGRTAALQYDAPRAAVLSTGNEIVEPGMRPGQHQVRNSNGPMLMAQLCRAGALPRFLGIAPDSEASLRSLIREGLWHNVLVISGGISAGDRDLVPSVLESEGARILAHGVSMRPGKPFLFATHPCGPIIFGLPGNPVSAFTCMELFVRPAIESMRGLQAPLEKHWQKAPLATDFSWKGDRPFYPPMRLDSKGLLHPTHLSGSADLRSIAGCNVLARLAPQGMLHAGDPVDIAILE